ncbi:DUF177 domain-containing protein [Nakamurella flavida]|uniref:DUF177 domain-containing protein n=1 Tax=Nakamurella flavida TaxID=363630 RepID=A0A939C1D5_9ACTN|nr:YceD family protein [Nakamurella flavida]MBM9474856.1 DUF177 domain-containing protein [Nakamurella flavida]MDP9776426.1 uncharacterized protein [Nakamurella flavida]
MAPPRLNSASPWVFDTRVLGRRPGTMRPVRISAPVTESLGLPVIAVPAGHEVELDLRLESVSEGVLVSGAATAEAVGECSRCLIEITQPVRVILRELYAYPGSTTAATTEDDEIPRLVDDLIDLEPLVRDELVLALPLVPLCRPDCLGLCPECGERREELEEGHSHETLDPRWAALKLKFGTDGPGNADPGTHTPSQN